MHRHYDEVLLNNIPKYSAQILKRFENVAVKDQLDRVAMDGSEKFRVQGQGVVREGLALGLPMHGFALYIAAWAHFVRREVAEGNEVRDMGAAMVTAPFQEGGTGLSAFLSMEDIFGELTRNDAWRERVTAMYDMIETDGISFAIDSLVGTADIDDADAVSAEAMVMAR